jgi:hypothetical protein
MTNHSEKSALLSITEAAAAIGCHADTLKRAEQRGLVTPRRTHAGARRYTPEQVEALRVALRPETCDPSPSANGEGNDDAA